MKLLAFASAACLLFGLTAAAQADTKKGSNKDKILGTWEAAGGNLPKGATAEFTKGGKVTITAKIGDKVASVDGTYEVDGDKLKTIHKENGKDVAETMKIITLTDTELVTKDEQGKVQKFKKKK